MKKGVVLISMILSSLFLFSEDNKVVSFQGQLSVNSQYSYNDFHYGLLGVRYLPQLNIEVPSRGDHKWDFEISADINAYASTLGPLDPNVHDGMIYTGTYVRDGKFVMMGSWIYPEIRYDAMGVIRPYRFWARYRYKSLELRLGLQKIDFGSSTVLRPLQWFNSMDPRDPQKITNGVFGMLARYYWKNSANAWLWVLTMNGDRRGMDLFTTHSFMPEIGGRYQYPVHKGELAFTYNHRWVDFSYLAYMPKDDNVHEDKFALDGKWDLGVGLWFEAAYSYMYTLGNSSTRMVVEPPSADELLVDVAHQYAVNVGIDYTFPIGGGLNVLAEHMIVRDVFNEEREIINTSALQVAYPIGIFDNLSIMGYYSWEEKVGSAFLSYMHSFPKLSLYANVYYNSQPAKFNPETIVAQENFQLGKGVGIQMMLVFNH